MKRLLGFLGGSLAIATLFAPLAQADPNTVNYEIIAWGEEVVCGYFGTNGVTPATVSTIAQYYLKEGFTPVESAEIVYRSVRYWCNQYLPALKVSATVGSGD